MVWNVRSLRSVTPASLVVMGGFRSSKCTQWIQKAIWPHKKFMSNNQQWNIKFDPISPRVVCEKDWKGKNVQNQNWYKIFIIQKSD